MQDKDKKINIVLIAISVIVFCVCLFLILTTKGETADTITLLKDMDNNEIRVIDDKTDVYNNSDEVLYIRNEKPDGYLNPEDVFKQEISKPILGTNENRVDGVYKPNNNRGELKMPEPGEEVIILEEVVVEEEVDKFIPISLNIMLSRLRDYRNSDYTLTDNGSVLFDINRKSFKLIDIVRDKPVVIIPFSIYSESSINVIKQSIPVYEECKDEIQFMYFNTSIEMQERPKDIREKLVSNGLPEDLPIYYDDFGVVTAPFRNLKYGIINSDCYIIYEGKGNMTTDIIETAISDYEKTMEEYKEQEEELVEYFNNGVIYNYQALDAYIEHIVDNVPLSKYFDEDGILKSEKVEEEVKDTEIES